MGTVQSGYRPFAPHEIPIGSLGTGSADRLSAMGRRRMGPVVCAPEPPSGRLRW
jgi:hypothetical protein